MVDPGLLRLLELVTRELECSDARVEIGGKDPEDPRVVHRPVGGTGRLVAIFESPPADRSKVQEHLDALINSFQVMSEQTIGPSSSRTPPDVARRRLDDELTRLAERASAKGVVVFDLTSPIVWGASRSAEGDVDALLEDAVNRVLEAHAELRPGHVSHIRVAQNIECLARPFAGQYVIGLVFEGVLSELVALGTLLHALPLIERLVLALPPVDPEPSGGKLVRLPVRLR
jgi:hypothetical protein